MGHLNKKAIQHWKKNISLHWFSFKRHAQYFSSWEKCSPKENHPTKEREKLKRESHSLEFFFFSQWKLSKEGKQNENFPFFRFASGKNPFSLFFLSNSLLVLNQQWIMLHHKLLFSSSICMEKRFFIIDGRKIWKKKSHQFRWKK